MTEKTTCDYAEELVKNRVIAFVPSGNSMWPTLKNKGQSVIVKYKTDKLKPMDVALYRRENGANVLHRVMRATETGYVMCGDSQFTLENVKEENVYGVMSGFYRGKRYIETSDPEYKERVLKWYSSEKRRKFRVKMFFFMNNLKTLPKRVLRKLFGRKNKDEGVKEDD